MIFLNLSDFIEKTKHIDVNKYINIRNVIDAFHNIHKGCKCQREAKIVLANNLYSNLITTLTEEEKNLLKTVFDNGEIIFQNGDTVLGKI